MKEFLELEDISVSLDDMNAYVDHVADRLKHTLGYSTGPTTQNPFASWMHGIGEDSLETGLKGGCW